MAINRTTTKTQLRRTFGTVAILLALGLLWLAFFGGSSSSTTGGQDFLSPSLSPLASTGTGFQSLEPAVPPALMASVSAAGVANAETIAATGDNVGVLVLSGAAALCFSGLVLFSTLRLRFGGLGTGRPNSGMLLRPNLLLSRLTKSTQSTSSQ